MAMAKGNKGNSQATGQGNGQEKPRGIWQRVKRKIASRREATRPIEYTVRFIVQPGNHKLVQTFRCPRCYGFLNATPFHAPNYCGECGQRLNFKGVVYKDYSKQEKREGGNGND